MQHEATPEHRWLMQLVGEWEYEGECVLGPDQAPMTGKGREIVRAIGDLWVQGELTGQMPGAGQMTGIMTLGFDPAKGRFIGTWIGSPMAHMFIYEGQRDGDTLPLNTTGPDFSDPAKTAKYRDVVEFKGPDQRILRSEALNEDGSWTPFMSAVYRRVR